jgi:4-hydroxyphenylpyruvate dioxygenase
VSRFAGAGVHHIALRTDDIFHTLSRLRHVGLPILRIYDNYYYDLDARLDLAPELIQRLRNNGVLYDRSVDGEFFHAYTETFEGRFFFEIVQRSGNYALFGAANAPARMAAQAQTEVILGDQAMCNLATTNL